MCGTDQTRPPYEQGLFSDEVKICDGSINFKQQAEDLPPVFVLDIVIRQGAQGPVSTINCGALTPDSRLAKLINECDLVNDQPALSSFANKFLFANAVRSHSLKQGVGQVRRGTGIGRKAIRPDLIGEFLCDRCSSNDDLDSMAQTRLLDGRYRGLHLRHSGGQ